MLASDTATAAAAAAPHAYSGPLWKRSRRLKSWRRRHAVLHPDGTLCFYRRGAGETGQDLRATFSLSPTCRAELAPEAHRLLHTFVLTGPGLQVFLGAESAMQAERWMERVRCHCTVWVLHHGGAPGGPGGTCGGGGGGGGSLRGGSAACGVEAEEAPAASALASLSAAASASASATTTATTAAAAAAAATPVAAAAAAAATPTAAAASSSGESAAGLSSSPGAGSSSTLPVAA